MISAIAPIAVSGLNAAETRLEGVAQNTASATESDNRQVDVVAVTGPGALPRARVIDGQAPLDPAAETVDRLQGRVAFALNADVFRVASDLTRATIDRLA